MRERIRKFAALPVGRKKLLFSSAAALLAAKLRLSLFGFRTALAPQPVEPSSPCCPEEISWAIAAAARFVPWSTCLVKALAGQAMLAKRGCASTLRIGMAPGRPNGRTLDAHAWLECEGRILIGAHDLERYRRLLAIPSRPA